MSPTARTLAYLRQKGGRPWIVEKWNPWAHIRQDLWGFIDVLSIDGKEITGWQACADGDVSKRIAKALALSDLALFKASGGRFFVIGWRKRGARGEAKRWEPRIEEL